MVMAVCGNNDKSIEYIIIIIIIYSESYPLRSRGKHSERKYFWKGSSDKLFYNNNNNIRLYTYIASTIIFFYELYAINVREWRVIFFSSVFCRNDYNMIHTYIIIYSCDNISIRIYFRNVPYILLYIHKIIICPRVASQNFRLPNTCFAKIINPKYALRETFMI